MSTSQNNNTPPVIYWRCISSGPFSVRYESVYFRELNKDTLYCNVDLHGYADKVEWLGDNKTPEGRRAYQTKSEALEEFKKKTLKMLEEEESRINAPVVYWKCCYRGDSKPKFRSVYFYVLNKHLPKPALETYNIQTQLPVNNPAFADCFPTKCEALNHYKEKTQKDILELEKEIFSEDEAK